MNKSTKEKIETEVCRSFDHLAMLDPNDEKYQKLSTKVIQLTDLLTKADDVSNRADIEQGKLDAEAKREQNRAGDESEKLRLEIEKTQLQSKLEENRLQFESEKLKQELELEQTKLRLQSSQLAAEEKRSRRERIKSYIIAGISGLITVGSFAGTWYFNARAQARSEYFEETGHCYTSRFSKFQLKEPSHPSMKI